jgi:hypothetical protein
VPIHHTADENSICEVIGRADALPKHRITEVRANGANMFEWEASSLVKTM